MATYRMWVRVKFPDTSVVDGVVYTGQTEDDVEEFQDSLGRGDVTAFHFEVHVTEGSPARTMVIRRKLLDKCQISVYTVEEK